jgi:hypothetical protein
MRISVSGYGDGQSNHTNDNHFPHQSFAVPLRSVVSAREALSPSRFIRYFYRSDEPHTLNEISYVLRLCTLIRTSCRAFSCVRYQYGSLNSGRFLTKENHRIGYILHSTWTFWPSSISYYGHPVSLTEMSKSLLLEPRNRWLTTIIRIIVTSGERATAIYFFESREVGSKQSYFPSD